VELVNTLKKKIALPEEDISTLMSNRYILTLTFDNEQKFPAVVISFLFDNLIQQVVFCLFWHITCYNLEQYVFSCVLHVSDLNSSSLIDYKLCVG
jgi:hypothetical protein